MNIQLVHEIDSASSIFLCVQLEMTACTQLDHIIILHHFQVYLILGHNEII